jgi:hypothetical protein
MPRRHVNGSEQPSPNRDLSAALPAKPTKQVHRSTNMNTNVVLEPEQLQLLDEALRLAYTRLVDAGVVYGFQFQSLRDRIIVPMVKAILAGEKNPMRVARLGMFAGFDALAFGKLTEPGVRSRPSAVA